MGLLDKALRGQIPATGKAASPISGRAVFSVPPETLEALSQELAALAPTTDCLLGAYGLIALRLPFSSLGLLWQGKEGLVLAAGRGFASLGQRPVHLGPFESLKAAFPVDDAFIGLLAPQLRLSPDQELRAQPCADPEGSVRALWLYGEAGFDKAPPSLIASLDGVFAASSGKASSLPILGSALGLAGPELLREGRQWASILLFELESLLEELQGEGIRPSEALAAIGGAAHRILGTSGSVFSPGPSRLVVLLYSKHPADAELALAQFRKSLRRALGVLAPAAKAPARALALSLEDPGAAGQFDRFLRL